MPQEFSYGVHTMLVDHEARRVLICSNVEVSDDDYQRDWRDVSEKLSELGVRTLSPGLSPDGVDIAVGSF
jgi:hypothetical protein